MVEMEEMGEMGGSEGERLVTVYYFGSYDSPV